jgi:hypothetical protein
MTNSKTHPVWDLYDELRTARLNVHYREKQLTTLQRKNLWIDIVLAATSSSGVAGLWLWATVAGGFIWKGILTIAALFAVIKPLMKLPEQIQQKSEVLTSWRLHDNELHKLSLIINQRQAYDDEIKKCFLALMDAKSSIIKQEPHEETDSKLEAMCNKIVRNELPEDNFFVPEEKTNAE